MQGENKLGEKIASLRRSRGLTQAELAEKLNFTHQAVSNWERGVSEPDTSTLIRLFGALVCLCGAGRRGRIRRFFARAAHPRGMVFILRARNKAGDGTQKIVNRMRRGKSAPCRFFVRDPIFCAVQAAGSLFAGEIIFPRRVKTLCKTRRLC